MLTHYDLIKSAMEKQGLTNSAICKLADIDGYVFRGMLAGQKNLTFHHAIAFGKVLEGVTAQQLLHAQLDFQLINNRVITQHVNYTDK